MKLLFVWACLFAACLGKTPNIMFIMMDDLGFGDISARHSEFWTPNLDELYHNSIVIDSHYIGISVCSPSRAQILTGRYAWNLGLASLSNFQTSSIASFPAGIPTIADLLKQHTEYRTYALGKWHVGYASAEHTPLYRGFDEFYGFLTSGIDYYDKTMSQPIYDGEYIDWWANDEFDFDTQNTFSTEATGNKVLEILNKHAYDDDYSSTPFYIYGAFQAPHEDLQYVSSKFESNCDDLIGDIDISDSSQVQNSRYAYCLNILKMDETLETIVSQLKQNRQWQNTLIVITSDNGGAFMKGSCNYPLAGGKSTYFDGGSRTVAFVGGGYVESSQQGTVRSGFMHGADWTPTLLSIAGANVGHVLSELELDVYTPVAAKVSIENYGDTEHTNEYLIDSPFDGIDLSDWILYGDESSNTRTNVPLAIGTIPENEFISDNVEEFHDDFPGDFPGGYPDEFPDEFHGMDGMEGDEANQLDEAEQQQGKEEEIVGILEDEIASDEQAAAVAVVAEKEDGEEDEARRLISQDHDGGDISVVWKSDITRNVYKMIWSPSSDRLEKQTCTMNDNKIGVELSAFLTNKLLFDLSLDSAEDTNLMDYLEESDSDNNVDGTGGLKRKLLKKKKGNKNKNKVSSLTDYDGDSDLVKSLWTEGLVLASGYQDSVLYNDYLSCAEKSFYSEGDPSQFDTPGWQPFMEFREYSKKFKNLCQDDTNDVLYELYVTTYETFIEAGQSRLSSKQSHVSAVAQNDEVDDNDNNNNENDKNDENEDEKDDKEENEDIQDYEVNEGDDEAMDKQEEQEEEGVENEMEEQQDGEGIEGNEDNEGNEENVSSEIDSGNAGHSPTINTHMFGNDTSHTLMIAGIVLAVAFVILGYCLFYWVNRRNEQKYDEYIIIGP